MPNNSKEKKGNHSKILNIDGITPNEEHNEIILSVEGQGSAPVLLDEDKNRKDQINVQVNYKDINYIDPETPYFCHNNDNRGQTDDVWIQSIVLSRTSLLKEIIESLGIDLRDTDPILYKEYEGEDDHKKREEEIYKEKKYTVPHFKIEEYPKESERFNRIIYRTHYDEITTTSTTAGPINSSTTPIPTSGGSSSSLGLTFVTSGVYPIPSTVQQKITRTVGRSVALTTAEPDSTPMIYAASFEFHVPSIDELMGSTTDSVDGTSASSTTIRPSNYVPPNVSTANAEEALIEPLGIGGAIVKEEHWSNEQIVEGYVNHMSNGLDGVFKITDKMYKDIMNCPHGKEDSNNINKIAKYENDPEGLRKILNAGAITFEGMWLSSPECKLISPAVFLMWTAAMFTESGLNGPAYDMPDPLNSAFDDGIMVAEAIGVDGGANAASAAGIDNCGEALYGLTHWDSKISMFMKTDPDIWTGKTANDYIADCNAMGIGDTKEGANYVYQHDTRMNSTWISRQSLGWQCKIAAIKVQDRDNSKDGSWIYKTYTHEQIAALDDDQYERMCGAVLLSKTGNYAVKNATIANAGENAYDDALASSIFSSRSNTLHYQHKTTGWHNAFVISMTLAWMLGKYIFENKKQELPPFPWNV